MAEDFCRRKIQILAINGGDGTISRTLTSLAKAYKDEPFPQIALLRGGTMNMLAENLGVRGTPESLLYQLITSHSVGAFNKTISLQPLLVDGHIGFMFANGTSARFLDEFYKNKTGSVGALKLIAKIVASFFLGGAYFKKIVKRELFKLKVSNQPSIKLGACSIFCSVVEKLPMGIPLFATLDRKNKFACIGITVSEKKLVQIGRAHV